MRAKYTGQIANNYGAYALTAVKLGTSTLNGPALASLISGGADSLMLPYHLRLAKTFENGLPWRRR